MSKINSRTKMKVNQAKFIKNFLLINPQEGKSTYRQAGDTHRDVHSIPDEGTLTRLELKYKGKWGWLTTHTWTKLHNQTRGKTIAVSQYAFFSDLASLCSRSTSLLTVEVQFHFSRTQVQRTHESSQMCSWNRGCVECRLERIEPLEIPEDAAGGRCMEACKL